MFPVYDKICNIINFQVCYHCHGNRGTKIMGWGDVRYCFAMAILVIIIILIILSFFLPPKVYPTHFSATTERKSMKLHRNVKHYE